jgi:adenosylmethionine-8-amino-7-oxononanoate aminotransferase
MADNFWMPTRAFGIWWPDLITSGLAQAAKDQYDRFPGYHAFFGRMSDQTVMLSEKLVEVSPFESGKVFYTNSGSEANDTMVKMLWFLHGSEGHDQRRKIITRKNAYHGVTGGFSLDDRQAL